MQEEVFRGLNRGATIITASRRLARVLTNAWHSRQRALGRSFWGMPDILPLSAFLERQWRDWVLRGASVDCPRLLNPLQEQIVWEQIILDSPAGETLLQISETARTAIQAWELIHAYKTPVDGRYEAAEDWAAFREWSQAFRKRCQTNQWMERARLNDFLRQRIAAGEVSIPPLLYRAGFDDLTPQQGAFFEMLNAREIVVESVAAPLMERCKAVDATQEIQAAAAWARRTLTEEPGAQIGIIVPDLKRLRPKVERIFQDTLDPAGDRERSFHVSLGPALGDYPLVRAALLILEFALGSLSLPRAGVLLRTPFLGGAESERSARALLDAKLRRRGIWDISIAGLRADAGSCPLLEGFLLRFDKELQRLPEKQSAREWSRDFTRLLKTLGWPGERTPDSREFQVLEAWEKLLSDLSALDLALAPMNYDQAFSRLRDIASHTPLQVENEAAPVQAMGMLEAAGLTFDHLWIMGLDDEALPSPANPNPFLPISLQLEYKMPHSSPERELEFSRGVLERLFGSSPHVVLSYPATAGDRALLPSPIVPVGAWRAAGQDTPALDWIACMRSGASMEQLQDELAPPVSADGMQAGGGSSVFKDIAACPFRAFAKHRLHAKPLEESRPGLSYRDRGNSVHKALELIWQELGSHARLMELAPDPLRKLVAQGAKAAANHLGGKSGLAVERRRLQALVLAWLEIEKSRDPFVVSKIEDQRLVTVCGLQVRTRADRVDELPDGRAILLDYKTGKLNSTGWEGDRPDEPQLPLYCLDGERSIAGAAFAQIRVGELGFRGLTGEGAGLPAMKRMAGDHPHTFEEQIAQWRRVLEALAEKFLTGSAEVDPKPGAWTIAASPRCAGFGSSKVIADRAARERALDTAASFIVQAPAGSGKTGLLIQRYLKLLEIAEAPDAVVAITFTRKAAGEMRSRVVESLRWAETGVPPEAEHDRLTFDIAQRALARDRQRNWNLLQNPAQLRIETIDALCAAITRRMPWLARFGAIPEISENAADLYREAARNALRHADQDHPALSYLLLHLDNDFQKAEQLICQMLEKRDQWLRQTGANPDFAAVPRNTGGLVQEADSRSSESSARPFR